jgi:proline dehydrogenase
VDVDGEEFTVLRRVLVAASRSRSLRHLATDVPVARRVADRFVAGDTLDEALTVTAELNARGLRVSLDHLGESVDAEDVARDAAGIYHEALARTRAAGLQASLSVKPSQLGLDVSPDLCEQLVGEICARAAEVGTHVTLDMEGSDHTQATVDLVVRLRAAGHGNVGCAVQTYLHRTLDDVRHLTRLGASLRICKGAYAEPDDIAYPDAAEVDDNFLRCAEVVLTSGTFGRFATHDHRIIARIRNLARRHQVVPGGYEFQLLYGVREPLQRELVACGEQVRVYVPFGDQWYPYLTRRLAERPANLLFFLRALAGKRT